MADNKAIKDYRDRTRINTQEPWEMQYWKKRFGVSGQQLAGAVRATGSSSVKKIEAYLDQKRSGKKKGK